MIMSLERRSQNTVVIHSTRLLLPMSFKSRLAKLTYRKKLGMSSFFADFQILFILILIFSNKMRQVNPLFMKHDNFVLLVAPKTKAFKVTTSNTRNLNGILAFTLQTFLVLVDWTMTFLHIHVTVHFNDFLILVTSKTEAFKVTTSNTRNLKGILAFTLQIFLVLVHWTMQFLCIHGKVHFDIFLFLNVFYVLIVLFSDASIASL